MDDNRLDQIQEQQGSASEHANRLVNNAAQLEVSDQSQRQSTNNHRIDPLSMLSAQVNQSTSLVSPLQHRLRVATPRSDQHVIQGRQLSPMDQVNPPQPTNDLGSSSIPVGIDNHANQIEQLQLNQQRPNIQVDLDNMRIRSLNNLRGNNIVAIPSFANRFQIVNEREEISVGQLHHFRQNLQLMPNRNVRVGQPRIIRLSNPSANIRLGVPIVQPFVPQQRRDQLIRLIRPLQPNPMGDNHARADVNQHGGNVEVRRPPSVVRSFQEALELERAVSRRNQSSDQAAGQERRPNSIFAPRLRPVAPLSSAGQSNRIHANMQMRQIYRIQNSPASSTARTSATGSRDNANPSNTDKSSVVSQLADEPMFPKEEHKMTNPQATNFCPQPVKISNGWRSALVESKPSSCMDNYDTVVEVGKYAYKLHRVILASRCAYFSAMFSSGMKECQFRKHITMKGMHAPSFHNLVEFIYTGKCTVSQDKVMSTFYHADVIPVPGLLQRCAQTLSMQMLPQNAISVWRFATFVQSPKLTMCTFNYILRNFKKITAYPEFKTLDAKEFTMIMTDDRVNLNNEKTVLAIVLQWFCCQDKEPEVLKELLYVPRFDQLHCYHAYKVIMASELMAIPVIRKQLIKSLQVFYGFTSQAAMRRVVNGAPPRETHANARQAILLVGGSVETARAPAQFDSGLELYDGTAVAWTGVSHSGYGRHWYDDQTAVWCQGCVYIVGGYDGSQCCSVVWRYDIETDAWTEMAGMVHDRCGASLCSIDNRIFALGGYDETDRLSSAEVYDVRIDRWTVMTNMHHRRSDAGCTAFRDVVYVAGGYDGEGYLSSVEYYNEPSKQWTCLADLERALTGCRLVGDGEFMYVVGGHDLQSKVKTCQVYITETNTWQHKAPMKYAKSSTSAVCMNGLIYVMGGYDDEGVTNTCEVYDPRYNKWNSMKELSHMKTSQSAILIPDMSKFKMCSKNRFPRRESAYTKAASSRTVGQ